MEHRYVIWDKKTDLITPVGEVLSPKEWIQRYPVANVLDTVCSGGAINGAIFEVYEQFKAMYEGMGADFSECTNQQEVLDKIAEFEDEQRVQSENYVSNEERIAAALEAQVMMSLDDIE